MSQSSLQDESNRNHKNMDKLVEFAHLIGKLKTTPRTGWLRKGVSRYESVADHSWRVAALSLLLCEEINVDVSKCIQLAVVHDIAECIIGDIAPSDNISKEEKMNKENEAVRQLSSLLPPKAATYLESLIHEYESRSTKEAIAAKDLDLLDMILQAEVYEITFGNDLAEFFETTPPSRFRTPFLKQFAEHVHAQRESRLSTTPTIPVNEGLSSVDNAFVKEYAMASDLDKDEIQKVVAALRAYENRY